MTLRRLPHIALIFVFCFFDFSTCSLQGQQSSHNSQMGEIRQEPDTLTNDLKISAPGSEEETGLYEQQVIRSVPDTVVDRLRKQRQFTYANDPSFWTTPENKDDGVVSLFRYLNETPIFKWLLYAFVLSLLVFVVYQVVAVNNFFVIKRRGKKKEKVETAFIPGRNDIDRWIDDAISRGEYRTATRFLYHKTLQTLHSRGFIKLSAQSTNEEYMRQMLHHPESIAFAKLTGMYDYVWYGEFEPDTIQFSNIQHHFNRFMTKF